MLDFAAAIGKADCGIDKAYHCGYTMSTKPLSYGAKGQSVMDHVQLWERNHSLLLRSFHIEAPLTRTQAAHLLFSTTPNFPSSCYSYRLAAMAHQICLR